MIDVDPVYDALLATPQDADERALAARYAPILRFDASEPFLPLAAGYTIFRADGPSPSMNRQITLATPEHPDAALAIEYAIWWDWDIGHLYELEHVWVYVDAQGRVVDCEASWHGRFRSMAQSGKLAIEGERVVVYSEPGKHAFAPDPAWFDERKQPHRRSITRGLAGIGGVLAPGMFSGKIARTPFYDTLARTYLADHAFDPAWKFSRAFTFDAAQLVPWTALYDWIPRRVNWWIERLANELDPASYRALRIGHRAAPMGGMGNTLAGIRRAAARGVDMVGADLYITVDGAIVAAPAPIMRDTAGLIWPVGGSTLDELRALDLGDGGEGFPTLDQLWATCREERVDLYAEIKDGRAIAEIVRLIRASGRTAFAFLGAARADWLAEVKALAPEIRTAVQLDSPHIDALLLAQSCGADYVFPCWAARDDQPVAQLTDDWVARAHAAGLGVIGWRSGRPEVRDAMQRLGLDAICDTGRLPAMAADERAARRVLAVCLDCGDTLVDEATEIKDAGEATQRAALIPGADELLRELARRGYRLALVADGPPATFANALAQHRLYDYFDAFAISGDLGCLKPDRRNFIHALAQLGIAPDEYGRVVMVGNNLAADIKGANALGMISVWLDWSPRRAKIPADATEVPRYTIKQPLELLRVLERLEQGGV
ncbi:MAG TPA: HAD-IA family hydrolase [Roseiflexaceae bacterium]|nr:HAD-IA family hydrolase [Roseiflexaceae bacterium]